MDIWEELDAIQKEGFGVNIYWNMHITIFTPKDKWIVVQHDPKQDFQKTIYQAILQFDERTAKHSKQSNIT